MGVVFTGINTQINKQTNSKTPFTLGRILLCRATCEVTVRSSHRDLGAAGTDFITLKSMQVAPGHPKEAPDPFSKSERLVSLLLERVHIFSMAGDLRRPVRRPGYLTGRPSVNGG